MTAGRTRGCPAEEGARGCALAAGGAEEAGSGPAAGEPCERPCGSTRCPGSRGRHRIATGDSGEDGAALRCFKRAASPHGFCLLLQRPRANSMYLEKEGRGWKSLSLQPRFQNYRVAWGGEGLDRAVRFGNDSLAALRSRRVYF